MNTIKCPHCKQEFPLTEALAAPVLEEAQKDLQAKLDAKDRAHADALRVATEAAAQKARTAAEKMSVATVEEEQRIAVNAQKKAQDLEKQLEDEKTSRATAVAEALKNAREAAEIRRKDAERFLMDAVRASDVAKTEAEKEAEALRKKLSDAQTAQAAAVRKERELEDAKREMELTIETQVSAGLTQARTQAQRDAEALLGLKLAESQAVIESLRKEADEMRHKATQGDQRLQGEVQELQIEAMLREKFPADTVEPVGKGVRGGDALLRVASGTNGTVAGAILFESKRTKTWDAKWPGKLREDMREAKADIAVIITATLPKGVETFDLVEGIWVTGMPTAMALTAVLRVVLQEVHGARVVGEGLATKAEIVYKYLTGPTFKARLQAAVEAFNGLQDGLRKERAAMQRQWSLREGLHEKAIGALVGMHGDLGAIAGASLPELEGAELGGLGALGPVA